MSQFIVGSTSQSAASTPAYANSPIYGSDDEDTLPYPTELPRNDFLTTNFDPQTYLSSLHNRHQTLEDLRSDLRQRSQLLNKELLDLVNGNYEEFLSLGGDLKGGDEKVESVRVGLLGFQRDIEGIAKVVGERKGEMGGLLREKKDLRREVVMGRALLEVSERVEEMEQRLGISSRDDEAESDEEDFDEEDDVSETLNGSSSSMPVARLRKHAEQYLLVLQQTDRIGPSHPFLVSLRPRIYEVRKTLLLDMSAALRKAKKDANDPSAIFALSAIFGRLDAEQEALKVLKGG